MPQLFLNNFDSQFIASVKSAPTTGSPATELDYGILRIASGAAAALGTLTGGDYYILTAFKRSGTVESNIEIMRVTNIDTSVINETRLTVSRAQEGTTAQSYVSGDYISLRLTKGGADNFLQKTGNLAGLDNPATARTNLGLAIGTNVQAYDADLAAVAALTTTGFVRRTGADTWAASALVNGDIPAALTGKSVNGVTPTSAATGFTIAGGTTSKTLTVSNTLTLAGTDGSTLNIGAGGTLGTGAFATIANYALLSGAAFTGTVSSTGDIYSGGTAKLGANPRTMLLTAGTTGDNVAALEVQGSRTANGSNFGTVDMYHQANRVAAITGFRGTAADEGGIRLWTKKAGGSITERVQLDADGNLVMVAGSMREARVAVAASNVDLALGNYFTRTISGATTLTVSNVPASGTTAAFILELTNGGSATVTWWSGVRWAAGTAPTLTASGVDIISFYSHDGGTNWRGALIAKDSK